ncbi:hypothetical protein QYE76_015715 [Lolium multiflorum]|uniref:Uncharacterized protein n=1 Tax=Lolium multiflorum TaxID=4521 RepID=A0AAD8X6N1_LOLMU|nr:hypothetical protein QYE76_015715 [Lolium multiflorum]
MDAVAKIQSETQELPKEDSALDLEISKPTQSAPEQETTVEDQCRSAWVSQVLEKQRCHFVHFLAHTAGTAPQVVEAGPEQEEAPENIADPVQAQPVGESKAPGEESILGNLSPISGDTASMESDDFVRKLEEYGRDDQPEVDSALPKQVLATVAPLEEQEGEDENTASDPGPSNVGSPLDRIRPLEDVLSPEELVEQARMDLVAKSGVLNKPITPDDAADPEALEATRQEMLATAKKFANTAAAMLDERTEAANFVEHFKKKDREVDESLAKVRELEKHWEAKVKFVEEEEARIRREAIPPRRITFATPTVQQPLATPKDNMKKAAEILKKKNEEIDIEFVRTLVASAVKQQSKADTSRRLESNPDQCVSTAQKDARVNRHPDDESRTGSSERRRKVREHPNPIPVPSKTPPSDPRKGKDAMYSGQEKYRNPSPPPNGYPRPPRRRSPAGNTRPQRHGGIVIRDNVLPRNGNRERSPEPRRNQNNPQEPEPRRSRNEERDPEPRRSHNPEPRRHDQGSQRHGEGSHRSRSQHREGRGESEAGSKKADRPPRRSPSPPPSGGGGGGGGGGGRRSRSRSKSPRHGSRDARDRLNEYRTDYIGPKCFGRMIREEPKPRSSLKLPGNLKHYDGTERPDTWIEDYYNAVTFAGGTPNIACRMLQLYLVGPARIWLSDLEKNSIFCWFDLKTAFEKHFRGTYKRPATASDLQAWKSTHTNRNCKWVNDLKNDPEAGYKRARKHRRRGKGGKGKSKDKEEDSSEAMDEDDNSPDPKAGAAGKSNPFEKKSYVRWSEVPCTFDREDHPAIVPKEYYALVVSPRIDGYDFSKCLMDGGASLNIMYLETLERMNLTKEQLKHSNTEFHGVVPGKKANSLGSITLPVAFGDVHNFREEKITFEVVPFKSSYHVIFGRPTYHKFHARACYIYNKLKMPGPNGMITVTGDYKKAHECELGEAAFAESVISGEELKGYRAAVDPTEMQTTKKQISEQKTSFKPAIETKKHDLIPGATYQRTMQRCKDQIGRNVHAYVDDIAVMTRKGSDLISDLTNLRQPPQIGQKLRMQIWSRNQRHGLCTSTDPSIKAQEPESPEVPTGEELQYVPQIHFEATNNMAEYEALLHGLRIAKEIGIKHIICCGDSDRWHNK